MEQNREQQFLSSLIQSLDNIKLAKQYKVEGGFFQKEETRSIFKVTIHMYDKFHTLPKEDTFRTELYKSKKLSQDQKNRVMVAFIDTLGTTPLSNFEIALDDFIEYYKREFLQKEVNTALEEIKKLDGTTAIEGLKSGISKLEKQTTRELSNSGYFGDDDFVAEYKDRKEHPEKYIGIPTGFQGFDNATNGLQKGTVTLIMGEMKSAKSVLMVNMAQHMFASGKKIYYHVNEGGYNLVRDRLVSCATGLLYGSIRNCKLLPEEEKVLEEFSQKIKSSNKLFIDSVGPVQSCANYIENRIREIGVPDVILVDYLNLMYTPDELAKSTHEKLGIITIELKNIAMKYQVPIVLLTHVNRKGMDSDGESYQMSDVGLSIEPLKHVDIIASWRIKEPLAFKESHKGDGILTIQGARDSETPTVVLHVDTNVMKITEQIAVMQVAPPPVPAAALSPNIQEGQSLGEFF